MISRRAALVGFGAMPLCSLARAEMSTGPTVSRRAADLAGRRPAVILLHGSRGIEIKPRAYERYVDALSRSGIDVYVLHYMTEADIAALDPKTSTSATREAYDAERFDGWAETVSVTLTAILRRDDCSGRIGLLGFSLGGYIAANTAARDERVADLAVLYGGMPDATVAKVSHPPPTIELHGDADTSVGVEHGRRLVATAKSVGAYAEFVPYAGRAHGFDFSDTDPSTKDAVDRVSRFFQAHLGA